MTPTGTRRCHSKQEKRQKVVVCRPWAPQKVHALRQDWGGLTVQLVAALIPFLARLPLIVEEYKLLVITDAQIPPQAETLKLGRSS